MKEHLPQVVIMGIADGELSADELRDAKQHLDHCLACSSAALDESLLKNAVRRAGQGYEMSEDFAVRMKTMLSSPAEQDEARDANVLRTRPPVPWSTASLWARAAILVLAIGVGTLIGVQSLKRGNGASEDARRVALRDALADEITDDHIATMAANQEPQVVSSDRHTVKPWFQGKLPFSFNLPASLPADVTLAGANLRYLRHQPAAQLIFTIGKHKASLFLQPRASTSGSDVNITRDGFHVYELAARDLEVIAVSDVDPPRLVELANLLRNAQTER